MSNPSRLDLIDEAAGVIDDGMADLDVSMHLRDEVAARIVDLVHDAIAPPRNACGICGGSHPFLMGMGDGRGDRFICGKCIETVIHVRIHDRTPSRRFRTDCRYCP